MKIAFYAPMKSPEHPVPSGDRRVARLLMKALDSADYDVELASELRSFDKIGDAAFQEEIRIQSLIEADRLIAEYLDRPSSERPAAWFTYHLYHKAPDWIGPRICKALGIPYLIAEASHAPKQEEGPWDSGYKAAAAAISTADRVFHMTRLDGECLSQIVRDPSVLKYLPPFLEDEPHTLDPTRARSLINQAGGDEHRFTLLSVAMMRAGDKLESYKQLADAMVLLPGDDWQLVIVGDGEERSTVEAFFAPCERQVVYLGRLESQDLFNLYHASDLYVWPAYGEAYGMAFLEAESCGLPVVAGNIRGVPDVVRDQETGLLCTPGDMREFAVFICKLLDNPVVRKEMGRNAQQFVRNERSLTHASEQLSTSISEVI